VVIERVITTGPEGIAIPEAEYAQTLPGFSTVMMKVALGYDPLGALCGV
jgi:hypothetical protein